VRELDVATLSPFLDCKVFNDDIPGMFSTLIRIQNVAGSLVILIKQRWPNTYAEVSSPSTGGTVTETYFLIKGSVFRIAFG
jgi:hypothetical protein